jgi:hypothetical protein
MALVAALVACTPQGETTLAPTMPVVLPPASAASTTAEPAPPTTTHPAGPRTGLRVNCEQPGVTLLVDGQDPGAFPVAVGLEPGEHTLRFSGDRYRPLERTIVVVAGQATDLGDVRLEVARGMATIRVVTPGARVLLVNGSDQREPPMTPISIDFDAGKAWVLHVTKVGYCEYVQPINFSDGVARKSIDVELRPGCGP